MFPLGQPNSINDFLISYRGKKSNTIRDSFYRFWKKNDLLKLFVVSSSGLYDGKMQSRDSFFILNYWNLDRWLFSSLIALEYSVIHAQFDLSMINVQMRCLEFHRKCCIFPTNVHSFLIEIKLLEDITPDACCVSRRKTFFFRYYKSPIWVVSSSSFSPCGDSFGRKLRNLIK